MNGKFRHGLSVIVACCALTGCGSEFFDRQPIETQPQITEAGNPPVSPKPKKLRSIIGKVASNGNAFPSSCQAARAIATDTSGFEKTADVARDCFFEIEVQAGKAWSFHFALATGGNAFLEFENGPDYFIPAYYVAEQAAAVYLGQISFQGNEALAEYEATAQSDRDSDGINDYDDSDDDNDGIKDENEADCDQDGVIDDDDLSSAC